MVTLLEALTIINFPLYIKPRGGEKEKKKKKKPSHQTPAQGSEVKWKQTQVVMRSLVAIKDYCGSICGRPVNKGWRYQ